jgi:hypothetical protein
MVASPSAAVALSALAIAAGCSGGGIVSAFSTVSILPTIIPSAATSSSSSSALSMSTVDPTVITKKEYQDICGVDFSDATLAERLARTAYLYPKHVEVIDDFAPMVDKMVDEIVSVVLIICTKLFSLYLVCEYIAATR